MRKIPETEPGWDVETQDLDTQITIFAAYGNTEKVRELIKKGAKVSARGLGGYKDAPLRAAAHNGHPATVGLLLEHGAEAVTTDEMGADSAVLRAGRKEDLESVRLLLQRYPLKRLLQWRSVTPGETKITDKIRLAVLKELDRRGAKEANQLRRSGEEIEP